MNIDKIKAAIEKAEIVSFDVFDTLIKRCVNSPEAVFELVGEKTGLSNFSEIRQKNQFYASQNAERQYGFPHADIQQIYDYIVRNEKIKANWEEIKKQELETERDCLYCNWEMREIYEYALERQKRVIITSDMYLTKSQVREILEECGYQGYHAMYISSDVHATKYSGDIYEVIKREESSYGKKILHIGDNYVSDYENALAHGIDAIHYISWKVKEDKKGEMPSVLEYGIAEKILSKQESFWYELGVSVGGPLYLGLGRWLKEKTRDIGYKKIFFLARDGYNAFEIMQDKLECDATYLYVSRRALLLAGITEINEEVLEVLPPFTLGQTVREVLQYLDVEEICGKHLDEAGISGLDYIVADLEDIYKVKQLYVLNEDAFLNKCKIEREYAKAYFEKIGFLNQDNIIFDCGWNGSSQYLLERFLKSINYAYHIYFLYVGILDTEKSRRQLKNKMYDTYLFDCGTALELQLKFRDAIVLPELFFSSPEASVYCYNENGVVFENDEENENYKMLIKEGIKAFVCEATPISEKYHIEITTANATSALIRLICSPTVEEAMKIGNLKNVDGFARQKGVEKYIAKVKEKDYKKNPNIEVYWIQGFLKRKDISKRFKRVIAKDRGIVFDEDKVLNNRSGQKFWKRKERKKQEVLPYEKWIFENEKNTEEIKELEYNPIFSVVVPVYNVIDEQLIACVESVKSQIYPFWELILVDDASTWENVRKTLARYENEKNIRVYYRIRNGHISETTNEGISYATGEYIAFMDCDDVIAPNALYEMAKKINENREYDFVYSDEDKLTEDGKRRHSPFFKPDWSPDTFMSLMYTNHLAVYRTKLVRETGGLRSEFNGTQDYDFTLRFMELSDNKKVGHVSKVLYHWRERGESIASNPEAKPYALEAMKRAKEETLQRRGYCGHVEYVDDMYQYRVVYENKAHDRVSIIIPSKDNLQLLEQCIKSIRSYTDYDNYEIIVVDNGSALENRVVIEKYLIENDVKYYYEKMPFNFSKMCNMGARLAEGKYLLFLNDDIEIINRDWLDKLLGHASLEHVGAVGAKLLYPNSNVIQHAGITNLQIGPSHSFIGFRDLDVYYFGRNRMDYNLLAVTAACMIVKKEKFFQVEGFDEALTVAYNDVDFCFKLYEKEYYNVIRNDVVMYHYESASRGSDDIDEKKKLRLKNEKDILYHKHPQLWHADPFYNKNLVQNKVDFSINVIAEEEKINKKYQVDGVVKSGKIDIIIDSVTYTDCVSISGWFYWMNEYLTNHVNIYLVLRDKDNEVVAYDVNRIDRPDVAEVLKKQIYDCGFRCNIPFSEMEFQEKKYQIGIMVSNDRFNIKRMNMTDKETRRIM